MLGRRGDKGRRQEERGGGLKEEVKSSLAETPPTRSKKTECKWLRGKRDFPEGEASTEILDLRAELLKRKRLFIRQPGEQGQTEASLS